MGVQVWEEEEEEDDDNGWVWEDEPWSPLQRREQERYPPPEDEKMADQSPPVECWTPSLPLVIVVD